jgi:hypothetical protein
LPYTEPEPDSGCDDRGHGYSTCQHGNEVVDWFAQLSVCTDKNYVIA